MLKRTVKIIFCLLAVSWFITGNQVGATLPLPGPANPCSVDEKSAFTCGEFGQSTIRFKGTTNTQCGSKTCTQYFYYYEGPTLSCPLWKLVDVAIPLKLTENVGSDAVQCDKYFTTGTGDNLNYYWGSGFFDLGICRIKPNNLDGIPFSGANFYIAADSSSYDYSKPLNWAMRSGLLFHTARIVGPAFAKTPVYEAAVTLNGQKNDNSCTYTIEGGQIIWPENCPSWRSVPLNQAKLCLPATTGQTISFGSWHCENITYMTEQADIKTSGDDPNCRTIGGVLRCN